MRKKSLESRSKSFENAKMKRKLELSELWTSQLCTLGTPNGQKKVQISRFFFVINNFYESWFFMVKKKHDLNHRYIRIIPYNINNIIFIIFKNFKNYFLWFWFKKYFFNKMTHFLALRDDSAPIISSPNWSRLL